MMLGSAGSDPEGSGSFGEVSGQALTHSPPSELWAFYPHSRALSRLHGLFLTGSLKPW